MSNKKIINVVKGDIKNAIQLGTYTRNTNNYANIEFDTKDKLIMLDGVPYSNKPLTKITYSELRNLRDNNLLAPGTFYRITDYECTTTLQNTQSAGHKFDIILLALSENSLLEEGWAIRNENNLYDVTFSDNVTKKCWIYFDGGHYNIVDDKTQLGDNSLSSGDITLDFSAKTASCPTLSSTSLITENLSYNNDYFKNSNLNAWKVWYCLDNDTSRFAWADDSVDESTEASVVDSRSNIYTRNSEADTTISNTPYYAWVNNNTNKFTTSETPSIGDDMFTISHNSTSKAGTVSSFTPAHQGTGLPNGRGVIYRLIDEWNNDVPYDFKNVMSTLLLDNSGGYDADNGSDTFVYTFDIYDDGVHKDASIPLIYYGQSESVVLARQNSWTNNVFYANNDASILIINNFYSDTPMAFYLNKLNVSVGSIFRGSCTNIYALGLDHCTLIGCGNSFFGFECYNLELENGFGMNYGNNGVELATKADLE